MSNLKEGAIPVCAPPDLNARPPKHSLPAKSCDCHAHIFGAEELYPYTSNRTYTPSRASLSQYIDMLSALDIERSVIVQPSVYGTDNSATLDAVRSGGHNFRGVVVVDGDIGESELELMHKQGVRGVRVNLLFKGGINLTLIPLLAEKIAPFGWHIQLLIDVSQFEDLERKFGILPVDVVFDHMGHFQTNKGMDTAGFKGMLKLLESGKAWVKISGAYRITSFVEAPYHDVSPIVQALVKVNYERLVWGSDWPHPQITTSMPNDGDLIDLLYEWVPNESIRKQILVDNPSLLYGFSG